MRQEFLYETTKQIIQIDLNNLQANLQLVSLKCKGRTANVQLPLFIDL